MKIQKIFFIIGVLASANASGSEKVGSKIQRVLDPDGKYLFNWQVNLVDSRIDFEVMVETTGFVGLGISARGQMNGADLFIAGVRNGSKYSYDMHGVGNNPIEDDHNDWNLVSAVESATHTHLKFWRLLNTCDDKDFPITNDTTRLIWSYGTTDDLGYHGDNKGTTSYNFLAPVQPEFDPTKFHRFDITSNTTMPADETTYWCTIHRGPAVTKKNHIVAFEALLDNPDALRHTHHFILTMCHAPTGVNATELFEPFVDHKGNDCYAAPENQMLPSRYCREYLYVWAVGGKATLLPDHVGYPFGETSTEIYYMLEVHYDNPMRIPNLTFKTGLSIYHTDKVRDIDAGLMWAPHDATPALIVPPMTSDFVISVHCPPACTNMIPPEGINVFNVLLHSHLAGRKMKFRHFRGNTDLPWILNDDNYDFNFQQNAHLWKEIKVLPGDQVTVECAYDTMDRNHTVVTGGLSAREEMCEATFFYYPKIPLFACGSSYPIDSAMTEYGVTNYTLEHVGADFQMPWVYAPESLAGPNGTDFLTVLNKKFNWTREFIDDMRISRQYGEHDFYCSAKGESTVFGKVRYPTLDQEYTPPSTCDL